MDLETELELQEKTAKLANIIDTYGINSQEYKEYQRKHTGNKYGLFYIFRRFGIKSNVFFEYIRPFLIKQMSRFTYNEFDDDLVAACYIHIVNAHCGYLTDKLDKNGNRIWKDAWVEDINNISINKWINFIITICRSTVCNRDYHFNKQTVELSHNDRLDDVLGNSKLDNLNYSSFSFKNFIFGKDMEEHINEIFQLKPSNNVLYNLIKWNLMGDDLDFQQPTSYNLGENAKCLS